MVPDLPEPLHHHLDAVRSQYLDSEGARNAFKVVFPFVLAGIYLTTVPLLFPSGWEQFFGFIVVYFVPPAGKETVIPAAIGAGFPTLAVVGYIAAIDIIVGLWIVWNWELALKIPGLRWIVTRAQTSGEEFLDNHEWMEDVAFAGLVLFVMIPFQGSGAVAASFVGRTVAVDPERVWYAIVIGATVGCLAIGVLGQSLIFAFQQAVGTGIAVVIGFVLVMVAGGYLVWDARRRKPPPHR